MNLATWSIRNPTPTILIFLFLTISGVWGFKQLHIQAFPDIDFPVVNATLIQPGAAPSQLESEVARIVEDSIASLKGIRTIGTSINEGIVNITVEFELDTDLNEAMMDVKSAIDKVRVNLPQDLQDPQVNKVTIGPGGYLATYSIAHPTMNEEELSWFVDYDVAKRIMGVKGIGSFERLGGVNREVLITIDPVKANALGLTATDISRALKLTQQEASGGLMKLGVMQQGVRTIGTLKRVDELKALNIATPSGQQVRLDQIATVVDTVSEQTKLARLNGQPAVGFRTMRTKGFDELTVVKAMADEMAKISAEYPELKIRRIQNSADNIKDQFVGSMSMLIEGSILAVIVIGLFLKDWRTTVIGAVALPLSILPTFAVMHWLDFTLNSITLLALAVIVGVLVDDAVVEVENIARHMRMGKSIRQATIDAVNEIAVAVLGTTATLVVVFLPTSLMSGIPGRVFSQFGWTLVVAVLMSLAVARMVTPVMSVWMLKPVDHVEKEGSIMRRYLHWVEWCLKHRRITVITSGLVFFLSLSLVSHIPTAFMPAEDNGLISLKYELPAGSSLDATNQVSEEIRKRVENIEGIAHVFSMIGSGGMDPSTGPSTGLIRKGTIDLVLLPRGERKSQQIIERQVKGVISDIAGARVSLASMHPGEKIIVLLAGDDDKVLRDSAQLVEREMRSLPYLSGFSSSATLDRSDLVIIPDERLMAEQGITTKEIGDTVRIALSGDFNPVLSKLNLETRQVDIRVRLPDEYRKSIEAVGQIRIRGKYGLVPLSSVADIGLASGPSQISRFNRQKQITITADLGGYPIGAAIRDRDQLPSVKNLPQGIRIVETGDAEVLGEMIGGFGMAILIGIFLIYAVMVLLFNNWLQPVTILSAVPLSVGGALIMLMVTGNALSMPSLIGLIMLLGIVTKNSILLVDFVVVARAERGLALHDALIDACRKRARPIVMTTVAMIAGLMPLAFGLGGGASLRQPMAIAVIGGLITSTALSLLVVPVVYFYLDRFSSRSRHD